MTRVDDAAKSGLGGMKEKYKDSQDVLICDSMPSIEFWFLIHYLNTAKYFADSKAVIVKLREWLPEYRKTGRFWKNANGLKICAAMGDWMRHVCGHLQ